MTRRIFSFYVPLLWLAAIPALWLGSHAVEEPHSSPLSAAQANLISIIALGVMRGEHPVLFWVSELAPYALLGLFALIYLAFEVRLSAGYSRRSAIAHFAPTFLGASTFAWLGLANVQMTAPVLDAAVGMSKLSGSLIVVGLFVFGWIVIDARRRAVAGSPKTEGARL